MNLVGYLYEYSRLRRNNSLKATLKSYGSHVIFKWQLMTSIPDHCNQMAQHFKAKVYWSLFY
jgi:hypothetical protein